ncbi:PTS sugar transporter subunit IIB [Streptomyces sp. NWU339]|uniref:PTS sugar transporter subunit IIB n=1 Tax=Streptomyces sp. NWU339 TaxID=2185284 RepID=UPI000D67D714|nr:PTS sugar transporter subunit IIB [Streptomyces sp. NWU339]PWI06677.1 PTS sugar transporter subunit IIB [Streptomyces sp. NWU339]
MKILVAAAAGMSTSLMVRKMEEYMTANGLVGVVDAVSVAEAKERIRECDVVLVAPQVRFELAGLHQIAEPLRIPVGGIPAPIFAGMKGEEAVRLAQDLIAQAAEPTS